jgi:hypothetical protein
MAKIIDYAIWNDIFDQEDDEKLNNDNVIGTRNFRILLTSLNLKANELFQRAVSENNQTGYEAAEASYRDLVRHIENASTDILNLMKGQEVRIYVSSYLNLICCGLKQSQFGNALQTCSFFTASLHANYNDVELSVGDDMKLQYFKAFALLSLQEDELSKRYTAYLEASTIVQKMKKKLIAFIPLSDHNVNYHELFDMLLSKKAVLLSEITNTIQTQLQSKLKDVLTYIKQKKQTKVTIYHHDAV